MILQNYNSNAVTDNNIVPLSRFLETQYSSAELDLYNIQTIRSYAFRNNSFINNVVGNNVTIINNNAFASCSALVTANFENCTVIGSSAFQWCTSLVTASFPKCISIYSYAFSSTNLRSLYLLGSSVVNLYSWALSSTPMSTVGTIYVPMSLVNTYKTSFSWRGFWSRIVGVE